MMLSILLGGGLGGVIAALLGVPLLSAIRKRRGYTPLVEPAPDAFPIAYRDPYVPGESVTTNDGAFLLDRRLLGERDNHSPPLEWNIALLRNIGKPPSLLDRPLNHNLSTIVSKSGMPPLDLDWIERARSNKPIDWEKEHPDAYYRSVQYQQSLSTGDVKQEYESIAMECEIAYE